MTLGALPYEPFVPGEVPDFHLSLSGEQSKKLVIPFGAMEGVLAPLPGLSQQEDNLRGIGMATNGSIYQTATEGNDREGDRED